MHVNHEAGKTMTVRTITVQLPETLYWQAKETAAARSLSIEEVVMQSIAISLPPLEDDLPADLRSALSSLMLLGDDELWAIARSEMDEPDQDRLEALTELREGGTLSYPENEEFEGLLSKSDFLMVKKAEAYRLLTRRGYSIPWVNQ